MSYNTFYKFFHTADVYVKTITTSAAGQKVASFVLSETIPLVLQAPSISTTGADRRRVSPYQDNIDTYELIIPAKYVTNINYENRVSNVKDRYGNIILAGPLEVFSIQPKFGFAGRLHHYQTMVRSVVETI
jgi:hypothetical protein